MEKRSAKFKSPFKSSKYKSFLTSLLSPSASKRPLQTKDSTKIKSSQSIEDENSYEKDISVGTPHHSSDSIYSTIENPGKSHMLKHAFSEMECRSSDLNLKLQCANDKMNDDIPSALATTTIKEPLYASVNKKNILNTDKSQAENFESQELKANNQILKERIQDLSEENRLLRKKLQDSAKEEKMKEETLHSKLQLKITELEAETRKDVKALSDRIEILVKEKELLNEFVDALQIEKKGIKVKHDDLCIKLRNMVSSDDHKKVVIEHQRLLNEERKKHMEEADKLKESYNELEESKASLQNYVEHLKSKLNSLEAKIENLEMTNQELQTEKIKLTEEAEESKHMEQDMQTLLLSLLKMTENIAMERNILLNKTSFQDHQQKEIQTTVIDYSLNIGRLQEHVLNLNKDSHQELLKLRTNTHSHDETLQRLYGKQLEILREKIFAQNNTIDDLEKDKRKLESQLELIWQAACGTNSKLLEDVKNILHSHALKDNKNTS